MAKKKLGHKRTCLSCSVRFYDLTKDPIICPSCGTEFRPEELMVSRRSRVKDKVEKPQEIEENVLLDDSEDDLKLDVANDDTILDNTDELDDGESVIPPVKVVDEKEEE